VLDVPVKCVGGSLRQIRGVNTKARDQDSFESEAADTKLPGKASKLQLHDDRTVIGHTWAG
jgi:hypothetical protein